MRVLVTGGHGLLGSEFVAMARARGLDVTAPPRTELDVTDATACVAFVDELRPDRVVHCAAWTAVDAAEDEPEAVMRVNRDGTRHMAEAAASAGAGLLLVSTDYVFSGDPAEPARPWRPGDPAQPASTYGRSKLAGERAATEVWSARRPDAPLLIVRTGWLYGAGGRNFVDSMLARAASGATLRVVDDQFGRPSWVRNVARVMVELLLLGEAGVWHVADGGSASWHELACEVMRLAGHAVEVAPVGSAEFAAPAPRPTWSVMDVSETEGRLGRAMQPWREALRDYLETKDWGTA